MTQQQADRVKRALESTTARVLVVVGVLVALAWSMTNTVAQRELTECLADYSNRANANQQQRADLVAQDRQALDDWIVHLDEGLKLPAGQSAAAIRAAITEYRVSRAEVDGQRKSSPIPPPPSAICG